ncbi:Periplasmic protein involved in polysaccharide export, contains SLBB domain of the beta-grasp fold [Chelatococcus sambhunathii]|uniref:Periplasmic protein involved in polysaccharide export, contains SLBB domain of the beta-grasp fold n=1 Tax=Chelatococcus sambhunathii TaxID=363953 RepID=A0ABM9U539_9HYPH|nr:MULTISPECIES: polysaccharide biosynthesis/export family protein [Chelatococcus]CUA87089.1 Periplasmic protein involved in polysaccharide export, contains SLBB domain of the beta-grasp fold [Chelatococcus sambhunathii]
MVSFPRSTPPVRNPAARPASAPALALAALLSGCFAPAANDGGPSAALSPTAAGATDATISRPDQPAPSSYRYRLGIGDRIRVTVFGEEALSGQFEIDGGGAVTLPLIGAVPAENQTLADLQDTLTRRFRGGLLRNPRIVVEILAYRPIFVLGEVRNSGEYKFRPGLSAFEAVALAGGFTPRADQRRIYIRRRGESEERAHDMARPVPVFPGDNLRVDERYF